MRIAVGSDHAGYRLKQHLVGVLKHWGHEVDDLGTTSEEPVDYPPFCAAVARAVASGEAERGLVFGGSGQGEQIDQLDESVARRVGNAFVRFTGADRVIDPRRRW